MDSKQFDRAARKVRVVAKIRGFSAPEANSEPVASRTVDWISVNRENLEDVTVSFGDQSSSRYLVDYCYKEDEDNEMIYSKEVRPLVSAAFEGRNSTIIAHGARGSGKTHTIQGSAERPGLAVLAVAEILSVAEKNGKSIAVSFYEVDHQERAVDLLNPEQPPILVFEDRGRIQFKGLTQVPVKSIAEFQNLYSTACFSQKGAPKKGGCEGGRERVRRIHMGLILHVFSQKKSVESLVSKMNFVDLAGYEDARKKSSDGSCLAEINNRINKSIYAVLNVCHALSTNESHVPYRESKLTRMLQDSLRGTSKILLVSCLNPSFCQDTIYMVSLASRACHWIHRASLDSTKKSGTSSIKMVNTHKNQISKSVSGTTKKLHGSSKLIGKKADITVKSAIKGRKLFEEVGHSAAKAEKKENSVAHVTQASEPLLDNSLLEAGNHVELNPGLEKDDSFSEASQNVNFNLMEENSMQDDSCLNASRKVEPNPLADQDILVDSEDHQTQALSVIVQEDPNLNKENNSSRKNEDGSPSISSQLRDLSNSLKMLCSLPTPTPLCVQIPEKESVLLDNKQVSADVAEPKTPTADQNMRVNRCDVMSAKSPWETYSMRGSGMKNSLVEEYLRFLNTANKEELKKLKGIGEKRATFILELREESPEPFKNLDDLKDIGLSAKQIKGMMKKEVGELFSEL
ncbi:kinesin-like protein KIN-10C isoform X1 [Cajanus cajan]|uniref:kinesin-like protein KIN-10C isoform X1 n=1 Tax=Cajanus cajan TaxID=3821 RepID=UPI00098DA814|nr:kinesin-like protein KIN-10C isoform X1 [Cajanus cajan]